MPGRVVSALQFFPRGGSAHVARALARELPAHGWQVTVLSGSRSGLDGHGDARAFYAGVDVRAVDFDGALSAPEPLDPPADCAPMHPSYEDRPGAPDAVFAALGDAALERQVDAWAQALAGAGAADADALHLHHLTPLNAAAARVAPDVPVVGHLHGTELLMLEQIAAGAPWPHGQAWARRMRAWAGACERLVLLSRSQIERATRLLGVDPARCVVLPNGFEPGRMGRVAVDRAAHWHEHLVERPRGWRPGAGPGTVRYGAEQAAALADGPVIVSVGRFTSVKRTPLLIEAFASARERFCEPASLVLVGGHPGEWEGEHPAKTVERIGAGRVYLAGWHDHDTLPAFLSAADVLALASVREQFGQVLVEAMAAGLPLIAVDRFGPAEIVEPGVTGWLVEPDDAAGLADALVAAVNDPAERARRGAAARAAAVERYAWPSLAGRLARTLDEVVSERRAGRTPPRCRAPA
ncbi:MAG TPA: glycosyltransferase family 4 protein [Solirubrobacteraceae bacterium]|jgi:glycosyltransferase involved in cell wall biosynthesis|nr:glycosyltransferase family 4 protein [Solirubrobacteraceae bacterium]